jgi:hypothetical protein
MAEKKTHFGRAGEYFAMSELLLRGWNVAVPVVDVGDDVFVIDDNDKTTFRLQVKSAEIGQPSDQSGAGAKAAFKLSRSQLRTQQPIELFYMLMVRVTDVWRFLVVPRQDLSDIRDTFVDTPEAGKRGRPALSDDDAKTDTLTFNVSFTEAGASGWGATLSSYLGTWPAVLAPVKSGPGSVGRKATAADPTSAEPPPLTQPAASPAPSPDHEK